MGRASFGVNNRPIELVNSTSGGTMISSLTYTYDNVGNRTNVAELDGGRTTWSYDRTYQLTREHRYGPLSWEGLSVDQWDAMTVDGWATMEPGWHPMPESFLGVVGTEVTSGQRVRSSFTERSCRDLAQNW